jgi:aminotransferase
MSLRASKRAEEIVQAEIRNMSVECDRVGGVNLSQGICDLEVPLPVRRGAQKAMDQGVNQYTRYDGLPELRQAISKKMREFNGIQADPEEHIVVSAGSTGAFYSAGMALLDPGDEVILFEPYYGYHLNTLWALGVVPAYARLTPPDWTFQVEELESLVNEKTRGIMINTPANPSGKVFPAEELRRLAQFCIRHDLFIFTDEIYEYLVYDGRKHLSPGALPDVFERTITISGYSKTYSITGWRIGYCVCHERWKTLIGFVNDLIYVCAPAPLQIGVAQGIEELAPDYYRALCLDYERKRDQLCSVLNRVGLAPCTPQGAYYILADARNLPGETSKDKAMNLLRATGVATVPGSAFYHDQGGENLLRFCFAKTDSVLDEACERLLRLQRG